MPTKVLCLGGGYVAARLARGLRRSIKRGDVELTVVCRNNFHTFHGFVHEVLTGKLQAGQILSPLRRILAPAIFHNAEIDEIDLKNSKVTISRLLDGRQSVLQFDQLVFALGSIDDLSRYSGLAEHSFRLKSYSDVFKTRSHILSMLEMAEIEADPEERKKFLTFVIAGGNFGGIETSSEIEHFLKTMTKKEYGRIKPEEIRVVVVHSTDRILPELHEHHEPLVKWAEKFLSKTLEFRPKTRVAAATADEVVLSTGERIPARTLISCTGIAQSPLLDKLDLPRDDRGRIMTDEFLRVRGEDGIWAGGDCASVPDPRGGICPALAIYAMYHGSQIAKNIKRGVAQRPPKAYKFAGLGDGCALARRKAVAHVHGMRLYGFPAWLAWRGLLLWFVPSFDRQLRIFLDWLVWPLVGRDVVSMKINEPIGVKRERFEPGQVIMREGDVGQRMFFIWKGEAEVLKDGPNGPERVKTIKEGEHFGETSILQNVKRIATVRALTPVEVISMGKSEAQALSAVSEGFGQQVKKPLISLEMPPSKVISPAERDFSI